MRPPGQQTADPLATCPIAGVMDRPADRVGIIAAGGNHKALAVANGAYSP